MKNLDWPLMANNITQDDLNIVIDFLHSCKRLTQGEQVESFEREWSTWLGVKHSIFVNSGASANLLTMSVLKELYGIGTVVVPPITWSSDIASVIQCGMHPQFVDVDIRTLGLNNSLVAKRVSSGTHAVFITHVLGYNALTDPLIELLKRLNIDLIEDVCEAHGAWHKTRKLGTIGWMSNFSFYYAHHMSTIEGGMVCTNDDTAYNIAKMMRSHGMSREASADVHQRCVDSYTQLNPEFIFMYPGYNMRNTEIGAVIGRSQLNRLDGNIAMRNYNLKLFLSLLDKDKYYTEFNLNGCSNYALTLVSRKVTPIMIRLTLQALGVEFRQGLSGGGNQLRQPYLRRRFNLDPASVPVADKLHNYGFYLGNYPSLDQNKISDLCAQLNELPTVDGEAWI